jgi:hypothetical protein
VTSAVSALVALLLLRLPSAPERPIIRRTFHGAPGRPPGDPLLPPPVAGIGTPYNTRFFSFLLLQ